MGGHVILRMITTQQVNLIHEVLSAYMSQDILTVGNAIFHVDAYTEQNMDQFKNDNKNMHNAVNYPITTSQAAFYLGMIENDDLIPQEGSREQLPPHFYIYFPKSFLEKPCMAANYVETNADLKPLTPKLNVLKSIIATSEHRKNIGLSEVQCLNNYNRTIDGVNGSRKTTYAEKLAKLKELNTADITFEVYSINYKYCNLISDAEGTPSAELKEFYDELLEGGTEIKRVKTDPKESLPSLYVMNWQE
ncbi:MULTISPECIES: hypothetical protein [Vibrio]|uniref:hypothetical protein n=1 Tax=Vibrio TaxID=662 RepID=UPI00207506DB|nr:MULTISPECIES: hypothetical protein [Vibrio]USD35628.1 hypothetical protein J8Z27_22735 [Vibrio sp. SCSIO 43186]USD72752.1 hypothetical protein J4N41_22740 [Vibrio sp. SCSIO 43139]USD98957.1 hypothetical protein CTT30_23065 [Vibrio coralliilyticus]